MSHFDEDTAGVRSADGWAVEIHPRWNIGNNPNGGYLLAVVVRAMLADSGRPDPLSVTAHYLVLPPDSPWGRPSESDPFELTGWIRFRDGTEPNQISAVTFADAFPPALLGSVALGWVPTVELTVHVRSRPAPGWMLGQFRTRFLLDGLMEEDGELWDSQGRPVALSRQLALLLAAPGPLTAGSSS